MRHIWPSIAASHAFVNSFRQHPVMLMLVSNITTRKERSAQVWKKKKKKGGIPSNNLFLLKLNIT
jgi:hypothetical protein